MVSKIKSTVKKFSYIIMPLLVLIICLKVNSSKYNFFNQTMYEKMEVLAGISGTIASILIAILTIYISLSNNDKIKRLKQTEHTKILINNIAMGIFLFFLYIIFWIVNFPSFYTMIVFLCALSNLIVTIYYVVVISRSI